MRESRKHYKETGHQNYVPTHLSEERIREVQQRLEKIRRK